MNLTAESSIAWEDVSTFSTNLLARAIVNNKKIPFFVPSYGQLMCPPGWRKLSKNALSSAYLMYEINSLPETKPPNLTGDEPQVIKDQILNKYYWTSPQYRLELFSSSDNGVTWVRRSKLPLMRPTGFPEGTINLLASLNNVVLSFASTDRLAIAFRDVGFGLPNVSVDAMTVTTTQAVDQLIYPFQALQKTTVNKVIFQRVTLATPTLFNTWQLLCKPEASRTNVVFSTSAVLSTTTCDVRYGTVAGTEGLIQSVSRLGETTGLAEYTGEIAFRYSAIIQRPVLTAVEDLVQ